MIIKRLHRRAISSNKVVNTSPPEKSVYPVPIKNLKQAKHPFEIFAYCSKNYKDCYDFVIDSWLKTNATKITIYTDFDIIPKNDKIKIVKYFDEPTKDWLEGTGRRLDVIKHFSNENKGQEKNIVFLDIDCYITGPISQIFSDKFDIAITRLFSKESHARKTATAGLWFARLQPGYYNFINDWFNLAKIFKERGMGITNYKISYVQYSFTHIARTGLTTRKYKILSIDENIYNSEHTILKDWLDKIKRYHPRILHFKGRRFRNKSIVQKVMKIVKKYELF